MDGAGVSCFRDLDRTAVRQFQRSIAERAGIARDTLTSTTVEKYLYLFTYLYRFRDEIVDGLTFNPFPGRSHGHVAGTREADMEPLPHTPDAVAVALIGHSLELITVATDNILQARQVYADAMVAAERRGCGISGSTNAANRALQEADLKVLGREYPLTRISHQ